MQINFAGFVPISTIDYTGKSSCVVFFKGCQFDCVYCHNHDHIDTTEMVDEWAIKDKIMQSSSFVNSVVFSGGEATNQSSVLISLAEYVVDELGLDVGIHTNGYNPDVIQKMINADVVNKVFMDLKACPTDNLLYNRVAGRHVDVKRIVQSIEILDKNYVETELRTTVFDNLIGEHGAIDDIAFWLNRNIKHKHCFEYVLQKGLIENAPKGSGLVEIDEELLISLAKGHVKLLFENVFVRTQKRNRIEI